MKLLKIVTKDVIRRKKRVLYATLGVAIGAMTVIGILTIARAGETRIQDQLEKYGPNLIIMPAISNLDMRLGDLSLGTLSVGDNYIPEQYLPEIRRIADTEIKKALNITDTGNIATVAPKLYTSTRVNGISVMLVGVEPQEEIVIKAWWRIRSGDYLERDDQALIGDTAAQVLQLKVGDSIKLNDRENVTVAGILESSGSADDYQIFVPLSTLQAAFNKEGLVSSVDVRALCTGCPVEVIADAVNNSLPGIRAVAVKQVAATEMGMLERVNSFMLALAGVTLAVGLFAVINTMIASVNERIKDIGIMRALGASRNQIVKIFAYEAVIIGILGGISGYGLGTLLAYLAGPVIFEGTQIKLIAMFFPLSLSLATAIAIVATTYPALRATRIKVADSFRSL
ncbi:MAG: hypothetical protein A2Z29_02180 [Chloroflexi bacterium RBG_16_56_11]|nr:MAG: hypothetical protein A2Z29_02180 [Chloroflexi bacterium RBG_16_56_11]